MSSSWALKSAASEPMRVTILRTPQRRTRRRRTTARRSIDLYGTTRRPYSSDLYAARPRVFDIYATRLASLEEEVPRQREEAESEPAPPQLPPAAARVPKEGQRVHWWRRPFFRRKWSLRPTRSFMAQNRTFLGLAQAVAAQELDVVSRDGIGDELVFETAKPERRYGRLFMAATLFALGVILFVLMALGTGALIARFGWVGAIGDIRFPDAVTLHEASPGVWTIDGSFDITLLMYNPSHLFTAFDSLTVAVMWLQHPQIPTPLHELGYGCLGQNTLHATNCSLLWTYADQPFLTRANTISISPALIEVLGRTTSVILSAVTYTSSQFVYEFGEGYSTVSMENVDLHTTFPAEQYPFILALVHQCSAVNRMLLAVYIKDILTGTWIYRIAHPIIGSDPLVAACGVI